MIFNVLNTLILLGSLQGFIFSYMLFSNSKESVPEKLLGTLLVLMSLASLNIYLTESVPYWQMDIFLSLVPTILIMPAGPLTYFYICFTLEPSLVWKRKNWLHFSPVIIDLLPIILGWILTVGYLLKRYSQATLLEWGTVIDQYNTYSDIPRWISITTYLLITKWFYLKRFSTTVKERTNESHFIFPWVNQFLNAFLAFQFVWLLFLVPYIIPATRFVVLESVGYYVIYIPLTVLIYTLGIKGYLISRHQAKSNNQNPSIRLTKQESDRVIAAVQKAMIEDKLYLEPDLDLKRLVQHTGSDQRTVSHVLNQHLSKSFNSFVNQYRIEEVKRRMLTSRYQHLKLSGIAYECGFNSQSTFQRAFRQFTHLSPKQYLSMQNHIPDKKYGQY